ncbi:MAG: PorV/PorQ family protein, partial [Bacteroidota bacterium]
MNRKLITIAAVCTSFAVQAQVLKYSNQFLMLGVGARAAGMGNASLASVSDATAAYWNPAGLTQISHNLEFALMHNEQFAGIVKHDYGTVAFRLNSANKSALAFSFIRVGVDDIPNTLNLFNNGQLDLSRVQNFSAIDYAFLASYARQTMIENLTVGVNTKIIRRVVGEFAGAWGFGFDIGAQYQLKQYRFGAMLRDATTTFNVWNFSFSESEKQVLLQTNNKLPQNSLELTAPLLQVGVARKWNLFNERFSVLPEITVDLSFDGNRNVWISSSYFNADPRMGLELGYKDNVFLLGGVTNFQRVTDIDGSRNLTFMPSIGAGLRI